jgi:16S rRNA processing protein RimM
VRYFEIGKIVNTHGVLGEMKVLPVTEDPRRFDLLAAVQVQRPGEALTPMDIERVGYHKQFVLLKLRGVDTLDAAALYKNASLKVPETQALPLGPDEYYFQDLYDCQVFTEEGEPLGVLAEILQTGANDVYVVRDGTGKDLLLPAIKDCVRAVDVAQRRITVRVLEGLRG